MTVTKSDLVNRMAEATGWTKVDCEVLLAGYLAHIIESLQEGDRVEIRGFGSFSLHYRAPRMGRNPKTGEAVALPGKHVPHFKPGKSLRERVDYS